MVLTIATTGTVRAVYTEALDLEELGTQHITTHISHVDPDENGRWWVELNPVDGPRLGPFRKKSEAIRAEVAWIEEHVL